MSDSIIDLSDIQKLENRFLNNPEYETVLKDLQANRKNNPNDIFSKINCEILESKGYVFFETRNHEYISYYAGCFEKLLKKYPGFLPVWYKIGALFFKTVNYPVAKYFLNTYEEITALLQCYEIQYGFFFEDSERIVRESINIEWAENDSAEDSDFGFYHDCYDDSNNIFCNSKEEGSDTDDERYLDITEENSTDAYVLYKRGMALSRLNRLSKAVASFEGALAIRQDFSEAWYGMGVAFGLFGRYLSSNWMDFDPENNCYYDSDVWEHNSKRLSSSDQFLKAIVCFDTAISLEPDYAQIWKDRGDIFNDMLKFSDAIDSFDKALEIDPNFGEAWNHRGLALNRLGRRTEAIDSYHNYLQFNPNDNEAWHNLGKLYDTIGQYRDAVTAFDKSITICPENNHSSDNLETTFAKLGHPEEAISYYTNATLLNPNKRQALLALGRAYLLQENYSKALTAFLEADAISGGNNGDVLLNLGNCYLKQGDYATAADTLQKARTVFGGNDAELMRSSGEAFLYLGQYFQAGVFFNYAIDTTDNAAMCDRIAKIYSSHGDHTRAINYYCEVLACEGYDFESYIIRGTAFIHLGRYEEALESFYRADDIDPGNAAVWDRLDEKIKLFLYHNRFVKKTDRSISMNSNIDDSEGPAYADISHDEGLYIAEFLIETEFDSLLSIITQENFLSLLENDFNDAFLKHLVLGWELYKIEFCDINEDNYWSFYKEPDEPDYLYEEVLPDLDWDTSFELIDERDN